MLEEVGSGEEAVRQIRLWLTPYWAWLDHKLASPVFVSILTVSEDNRSARDVMAAGSFELRLSILRMS